MTALEPLASINTGGWTPINLAEDSEEAPEEPQFGGFGIVYNGKRHVFSGPQESAKTIAAYAIGIETLRAVPTREIMVIDYEMGRRAARIRLRELGATLEELSRILYYEPETSASEGTVNTLISHYPLLVIIDAAAGAYSMQGLDDNNRGDVQRFSNLFVDSFYREGIATIVLDHVVKNSETRGKYAIGSERKTGGVDVHLGFDTILPIKRGSHGLYKITTHKDRDGWHERGKLAELALQSDPDTHQITWEWRRTEHTDDPNSWLPTIYMERVSRYLMDDGEPCSRKHLEDNVEGGTDYIRAACAQLVRLGYATETRGARHARMYAGTRLFTEDIWQTDPQNTTSPHLASTSPEAKSVRPRHLASPPTGGASVGERRTATQNGTTSPEDPEAAEMLKQYGLSDLEPVQLPPADDIPF